MRLLGRHSSVRQLPQNFSLKYSAHVYVIALGEQHLPWSQYAISVITLNKILITHGELNP